MAKDSIINNIISKEQAYGLLKDDTAIAPRRAQLAKMTDAELTNLLANIKPAQKYEAKGFDFLNPAQNTNKTNAPQSVFSNFSSDDQSIESILGLDFSTSSPTAPSKQEPKPQTKQEAITTREFAKVWVDYTLKQAQGTLEQYYDNNGFASMAFYFEKISEGISAGLNKVGLGSSATTKNVITNLAATRLNANGVGTQSERMFANGLSECGIEYDQAGARELQEYIEKNPEFNPEDKEYKSLMNKAFGADFAKLQEDVVKKIGYKQFTAGTADIAVMLYSLGAAAEIKGVASATQAVIKAGAKFGKVGTTAGSMLIGGTNLAAWTATTGTVNNLTKAAETTSDDWKNMGIATAESFGFGAFGGLLNATVIAPVVNAVSKPAQKAANVVANSFVKEASMSGKDVMQTFLTNQVPTKVGKAIGFGTEIVGFTAYETALDVVKDICTPDGRLPEDMTVEGLAKYLGEKFVGQAKMLGEIKGISNILMMHKGGKLGQKAIIDNMLNKANVLEQVKVEKVTVDGKDVYEVTMPDGNKATAGSVEQVLGYCESLMNASMKNVQGTKPTENSTPEVPLARKIKTAKTTDITQQEGSEVVTDEAIVNQQIAGNTENTGAKKKVTVNRVASQAVTQLLKAKACTVLGMSPLDLETTIQSMKSANKYLVMQGNALNKKINAQSTKNKIINYKNKTVKITNHMKNIVSSYFKVKACLKFGLTPLDLENKIQMVKFFNKYYSDKLKQKINKAEDGIKVVAPKEKVIAKGEDSNITTKFDKAAKEYDELSETRVYKDAMHWLEVSQSDRPRKEIVTQDEKTLYAYSTEYFSPLNPYLNGDKKTSTYLMGIYEASPNDLSLMEKSLNKALLEGPVEAFQGTSLRWQPAGSFDKFYSVKEGESFVEKGFYSTSGDFNSIEQFRNDLYYSTDYKHPELVMVEGHSGRNISDYSMRPYENEVLFPSESSFELTKREHISSIDEVPEALKAKMTTPGRLEFKPFDIIYIKERNVEALKTDIIKDRVETDLTKPATKVEGKGESATETNLLNSENAEPLAPLPKKTQGPIILFGMMTKGEKPVMSFENKVEIIKERLEIGPHLFLYDKKLLKSLNQNNVDVVLDLIDNKITITDINRFLKSCTINGKIDEKKLMSLKELAKQGFNKPTMVLKLCSNKKTGEIDNNLLNTVKSAQDKGYMPDDIKNIFKYLKTENGTIDVESLDILTSIERPFLKNGQLLNKNSNAENLKTIKEIAEYKTEDGKYFFSRDQVLDISYTKKELTFFKKITETNSEPKINITSNDLYELVFDRQTEKYGCENFAQLETFFKTTTDKKNVGMLIGQIKKQAIDDFYDSLPENMQVLFASKSGFTAKDLDKTLGFLNENNLLNEGLENTAKTGKIEMNSNYDKSTVIQRFIANKFLPDLKYIIKEVFIFNKNPQNPKEFRKQIERFSELYDVVEQKDHEVIKDKEKSQLIKDQKRVRLIRRMSEVYDLIGDGNLSAIVHNESANKTANIMHDLTKISKLPNAEKIKEIFNSNILKYNELRQFISTLATIQEIGDTKILPLIIEDIKNNQKYDSEKINKMIYTKIAEESGFSKEELAKINNETLKGWDEEYFPYILNLLDLDEATPNKEIITENLLKTTIDNDYQRFLFDEGTPNGKLNLETKRIFENEGLDFDVWMNYNKEQNFNFTPKTISVESISKSFIEDINILNKNSNIENQITSLFEKNSILINDNKITTIDKQTVSNEEMIDLMRQMNVLLNDNAKYLHEYGIADIKDHFKARIKALQTNIKANTPEKMSLSLWKRNPKHDLFQGHYCQCCISLDGENGQAIVDSLSHVVDNIVELKNGDGKTVGKVKLLWIKDTKTNEPMLLANGFEIVPPYNENNEIREQFVKYLVDYSTAVAKKPVKILAGKTYQKINIDDLSNYELESQLLGKVVDDTYHLDSYNETTGDSWPDNLDKPVKLDLKVLYNPDKK